MRLDMSGLDRISFVLYGQSGPAERYMNLITMKEAAALLHCSRAAIYARMTEPDFPATARVGKRRLIDADELETWLRARLANGDKPTGQTPGRCAGRPRNAGQGAGKG